MGQRYLRSLAMSMTDFEVRILKLFIRMKKRRQKMEWEVSEEIKNLNEVSK